MKMDLSVMYKIKIYSVYLEDIYTFHQKEYKREIVDLEFY